MSNLSRIQLWVPSILIWFCPVSLSSSWVLWWCSPRTEWYHRVTGFPPRLSQLRQLYVADYNRGEEPDPANLRHTGAGGRLWYCISLRWTTVAWQLKNEVRNDSFFYPAPPLLSSLFFFAPLWLTQFDCGLFFSSTHLPPLNRNLTFGQQHISLNTYFSLRWEMTQWLWSQRTASVSLNLRGFSVISDQ